MKRKKWEPLQELERVQKQMNLLFERALASTDYGGSAGLGAWTPTADVVDSAEAYQVDVELPGIPREAVDVRIEDRNLVVEGERRMDTDGPTPGRFLRVERSYGRFQRRFPLPPEASREGIEAVLHAGVLRIRLPKAAGGGSGTIRVAIQDETAQEP